MVTLIPPSATLASLFKNHAALVRDVSILQIQVLPMGAYDPESVKTWLSALDTHCVIHPDMVDGDVTISRTVDHTDIRHGAVMARESILQSKACNS
jgi:hypothetical protein